MVLHWSMKRMVLVELKIGEFEPQDGEKVECYLQRIEKYEKAESEESPVLLIPFGKNHKKPLNLWD